MTPTPLFMLIGLCAGIFILDYFSPLGVITDISYILLVFCSLWFNRLAYSFLFAGIATILIIITYFISIDGTGNPYKILANRFLSLIVIWAAATVIYLLNKSKETLAANEDRMRIILDTASDGVLAVNSRGIITSVNLALKKMFGYEEKELIGQNISILMPSKVRPNHNQYVSNYVAKGDARIMATDRQVTGIHKDGHEIPLEVGLNKSDRTGSDINVIAVVRDITSRKLAEKEREDLVEKLTQSNAELERFAYVASHDLQEPLRMIRSFTTLLRERYGEKLDQEAKKYMDISVTSATRMQELVDDLLEYARIGENTEQYEQVDSQKSLKYVLANLEEHIKNTNALITNDNLPKFKGNFIRFSRLLQNLIGNALKYQTKGNKPEIHLAVVDQNNDWLFSVKDNGIGMKQEYCEQIFQPFKRLHNSQTYSGTGMGLSICRKIVENLGGKIWANSTPGQGTTFYFTVPKDGHTDIGKEAS